jgi:hypothetical protein
MAEPEVESMLREQAARWAEVRVASGFAERGEITPATRAAAQALGLEPSALEDILQVWIFEAGRESKRRSAESKRRRGLAGTPAPGPC